MAYIPPALRKKETSAEEPFPSLTTASFPVLSKTNLKSFAEKAKEWEEQRAQLDIKVRVDEEIQKHKKHLAAKAAEEDAYIASQFRSFKKKEEKVEVVEEVVKKEEEWVLIEKKPRKKKEFDFTEPPDVPSDGSVDCWDESYNGSSWT